MRIGILAIVSGVALSLSAAAFASETPGNATEQTVSANNSQKIVCHYVAHQGTLMPKPYCGTQYAWEREMRRQQQELSDLQVHSYTVPMK